VAGVILLSTALVMTSGLLREEDSLVQAAASKTKKSGQDKAPVEEEAQRFYLTAMELYDSRQYEAALSKLADAARAARKLPDRGWRNSVTRQVREAEIGVLYEAGLQAFRIESHEASYSLFKRCLDRMRKGDKRRNTVKRNLAKVAYIRTLQLWLNHKYTQARKIARVAQVNAKSAFPAGDPMRARLDEVHTKITMTHTEELVAQGEIKQAYTELKKDFRVNPDPRFAFQLGELGWQLRLYSEAERYYKKASASAKQGAADGESQLLDLVSQSQERLVHIRSLRKQIRVRSNVPFYDVKLYRPFTEKPHKEAEVEDANEGVVFDVYPGRYRVRVFNADYGVCLRENQRVQRRDLIIECDFEKPPTSVSFDTTPRGVRAKVVPSTMVAFRPTPFYTELYRGSYTLLVQMEGIPDPVEVPFVVQEEEKQDFKFDLDFGEIFIELPDEHRDATLKLDGRIRGLSVTNTYRVSIGSHVVEITKPGYLPIRQKIAVRPREMKTLLYGLTPEKMEIPDDVHAVPSLDMRVGYKGSFTPMNVTQNPPGAASAQTSPFSNALHGAEVEVRAYLVTEADAFAKPFIHLGTTMDLGIGKPIDTIFLLDLELGFGVLLNRFEEAAWRFSADYGLTHGMWKDNAVDTNHQAGVLQLASGGLHADGYVSLFHAALDAQFRMGFGGDPGGFRYDEGTPVDGQFGSVRYSTHVDTTWLHLAAFVGVDLWDIGGFDRDTDIVLGANVGVQHYAEDHEIVASDEDETLFNSDQDYENTTPLLGVGVRLRHLFESDGRFRTAVNCRLDTSFIGGLDRTSPLLLDDEQEIETLLGASSFRLGLELLF
jgi:tetratricopeptide (TPR) repeat protein